MKIVFVLENYFPNIGGVETLFKNLTEVLAAEGHQITVITSRVRAGLPLKEQKNNHTIIRVPFKNRYLFTFLGFFWVIPHLKNSDLVHTTSYNAAIPAWLGAFFFRKKVIITFHEVWNNLWFDLPQMSKIAQWAHYFFEKMLLQLPFHHFVGVSKSTSDDLIKAGISPQNVTTIYNGIDYNEFSARHCPPNDDSFTFTYFGRLGISKGVNLLMEAFTVTGKHFPNSKLQLIIPKDPASMLRHIERWIAANQLEKKVILRHELSFEALKKEIQQSNCVVIPSYSEGFCFAAVETIALGVPVISSNQKALKEVVSGKFIKMATFSVESLVASMEQAIRGEWEESPIQQFPLSATIQQYQRLYSHILTKENT